jgi:hypothetical protein
MSKVDLRQLPKHMREAVAEKMNSMEHRKRELRENNPMHSNAEYQRRSSMSQDDRNREAIDKCAVGRKEFNDSMAGKDTSFETARREVLGVVHKKLRDDGVE